MKYNVGINEGINSSVVVEHEGRIIFALQEERVTQVKNFMGFPHQALAFTMNHLGITKDDIATICLSNLLSNIITNDLYLEVYETRADHTE
ncbi:MAG: putative Carbamoyltransferase, NodU family, partial [Paenibacillus sp.]|nr:putative Carbamoyltransferase, NodU family [Paenibacillus sp.]